MGIGYLIYQFLSLLVVGTEDNPVVRYFVVVVIRYVIYIFSAELTAYRIAYADTLAQGDRPLAEREGIEVTGSKGSEHTAALDGA